MVVLRDLLSIFDTGAAHNSGASRVILPNRNVGCTPACTSGQTRACAIAMGDTRIMRGNHLRRKGSSGGPTNICGLGAAIQLACLPVARRLFLVTAMTRHVTTGARVRTQPLAWTLQFTSPAHYDLLCSVQ